MKINKLITSAFLIASLLFPNHKCYAESDEIELKDTNLNNDKTLTQIIEEEKFIFKFAYITQDCNIFDENYEVATGIEKYQKVLIIKEVDDFSIIVYQRENDYQFGYLLNTNYKILPDTFIEIDISSQNIKMYLDKELIVNSPIVTGLDGVSPTYLGYYAINYKETNATLESYNSDGSLKYASFVDYWMPFNGGIGLHDAEYHSHEDGTTHGWRAASTFGGDTYLYNGSHGCVNLLNETAETIYNNASSGTKVLVHK